MKLQPRDYQVEAVASLYRYFETKPGNPILALPTGTGKSVVIAMFLESIFRSYPNQRILVLTHVKELITQNFDEFKLMWPTAPAGIYSAGLNKRDTHHAIIFAGIASVAKNPQLFGRIDLVIIDEAHLVSPNEETMYQRFLIALTKTNSYLKVIGLTATPWRLGAGHLTNDGIFTDVAFDITGMEAFNRLIREGHLALLIPKQTATLLDVTGVHMSGGEFKQGELQIAVDKYEITQRAVREICEKGADRKHWLIFASGIDHADHIVEMLAAFEIDAISIHSKMDKDERNSAIADWKSGRYRCAVNMNMLTTGVNFPGIDLIGVLRPTASTVLWVQMLGRGTRPCKGKENCLVLDFAGNTRRLGPINDPLIPRKRGDKIGGEAPVKVCDACGTYNHTRATHCINCNTEFIFQTKLMQFASGDVLIKDDNPIVEIFKVDHIAYAKQERRDMPAKMKVSYYCGYRMFQEYVCLEHPYENYAHRKAREWWRDKTERTELPENVDEALGRSSEIRASTHIQVWTNTKYPDILRHCYDNTAFGTLDATAQLALKIQAPIEQLNLPTNYFSDDIPF